ncbi:YicC/YloC family endoribonuclease [Magnetospirillum sp. 64-120]|uniref:YicC/YloC family endoribonuclease n=1 Tax=Magnetospirillum sp. 64-120 TaxID=1895778 RepID=UPI000925F6CD|nr:YicC/YloC family endoribonuclease [Magnetospirillum sp. 64-120]OJX79446.1 MAG: YicC family protein [Magnetospirillum sp. 64-120]
MSIASMTGYARAEGRDAQTTWLWEAKSVNGKGLDVRCRLPHGLDGVEIAARDLATRKLKRGNVQLSLTLTANAQGPGLRVNKEFLAELVALVDEMGPSHQNIAPARWDGLLAVKGVLETANGDEAEPEDIRDAREAAIKADLEKVLDSLAAMRGVEGERIQAVLASQLDEVATLADRAGATAALRPEAVRERLRQQVASVLEAAPSLGEDRIAQEVALIAVKADVREELDRLRAHVAAARDLIAQGGAVGRKLDFLSQEFNREANTLCSKSSDVELTRIGLDLKAVIDQFREQVQNIE